PDEGNSQGNPELCLSPLYYFCVSDVTCYFFMFLYYRHAELDARMIPGRDVVCISYEFYSCPAAKLGFEYRESRIWMLDLFSVQVGIGEHVTRVLYLRVYRQAIKPAGIVDDNGSVQIF